jgi:uncharacterized membrane protein HdeD (DUF308 family)
MVMIKAAETVQKEMMNLKQLRFARLGYILISILFYIAGLYCILSHRLGSVESAIISGIILIVYGIIKIIGYVSKDIYSLAFQYDFACGTLLIVLGIIVLFVYARFFEYLSPGLGVLILLDSLLSIQTSIDAQKFGIRQWHVILAASLVAGTFGVIQIVIGSHLTAGLALLAEGFLRMCVVLYTVPSARHA